MEWKEIKHLAYLGKYYISDTGLIKNEKGIILKPHKNKNDYPRVGLKRDYTGKQVKVFIHRIIAEYFIPNPDNKPEVNHINGDKNDYRIENLEWVTNSENIKHAIKTGLLIPNTKGMIEHNKKFGRYSKMRNNSDFKEKQKEWHNKATENRFKNKLKEYEETYNLFNNGISAIKIGKLKGINRRSVYDRIKLYKKYINEQS